MSEEGPISELVQRLRAGATADGRLTAFMVCEHCGQPGPAPADCTVEARRLAAHPTRQAGA